MLRWMKAFGWGFLSGAIAAAIAAWQLRKTRTLRLEIVAERRPIPRKETREREPE
ncbi:MAG: hypothetical protein KatS3mg115_1353 [Candidatus Poribacteria bacterium]|nr:MAG: hypothetical protein KatS3mg115_1353 [Candidatus Poribacteria bacterium]